MIITKWDQRFIDLAHNVASWSKDPAAQVGAVLVSSDRRELAVGYNGFPRGIDDSNERLNDKIQKNKLMVHAEVNAIRNTRQAVNGWTLYVTKHPCLDCALEIIGVGLYKVVCPDIKMDSAWRATMVEARNALKEGGIIYRTYTQEE